MLKQSLPFTTVHIIPETNSDQVKFEKSIRSLQFRYRANHLSNQVKKQLGLAQTYESADYPFFMNGNEPNIPVSYNNKIRDTNFTLVSTGGLKAFEIINTGLAWSEIDLLSLNLVTPKLFVIDYSKEAKVFWKFVKKLFIENQTYEDMCNILYDIRDKKFDFESSKAFKYAPENIRYPHSINTRQGCYEVIVERFIYMPHMHDRFNFIRNIIVMATFCGNNWFEKKFFANLAQHVNSKATYVYCSNILDCTLGVRESSQTQEQHEFAVKNFVSSVCSLNPILTIYSRTPLSLFETGNGLIPEALVGVGSNNVERHIAALRNPKLAPLTAADYEEYKKAKQPCHKRCNYT